MIIGMGVLLLFALPPLLALGRVPPGRVLRADVNTPERRYRSANLLALVSVGALVFWQAQDPLLAGYVLGGGMLSVLALTSSAWLVIRLLGRLRSRVGVAWRFGLANVARRTSASVMQITALGLGFTMLVLLALIRNDLIQQWRSSLPANAPNYFLVNIQATQIDGIKRLLGRNGLQAAEVKPMIKSRLVAVNGQQANAERYPNHRAQHRLSHGFNLSIAPLLQTDNRIVAGKFWPPGGSRKAEISVEKDIAKAFNLKVGDHLSFRISATGTLFTATVSSIRSVDWDSFHVNFFVVTSPGYLEKFPAGYVSSFHLPTGQREVLTELGATISERHRYRCRCPGEQGPGNHGSGHCRYGECVRPDPAGRTDCALRRLAVYPTRTAL